MGMNYLAFFGSALVTLVMGFIWYHPKVFGTVWMKEAGLNPEDMQKGSMAKVFILTYIFSLLILMVLMGITIHEFGATSLIGGPMEVAHAKPSYTAFMADYGTNFRTFKHGLLHGTMTGLFLAFPIFAITGMFERKSWKYIFINAGYWTVCLALMGGILCQWL